jgi:ribonuclease HII
MKKGKFIVGIDEAGRGPLAGPVAVAAVAGELKNQNSKIKILEGIKDSKKLSAKKREEWYKILKKNFECHCVFIGHKTIDKINIHRAALWGVAKVLEKFKKRPDSVLLDGSLHAPPEFRQKTVVKGDEKIPLISAASIVAKVNRDRKMSGLHKKFPYYGFDRHNGYGTKLHYKKIKRHGLSVIHRRSFVKNIK